MLESNQVVLEQEILGAILKNSELIITAREKIKPYMFRYKPHVRIYVGILEMVSNKLEIDLVNFLEYHKENIREMDSITYVSEIYSCNSSEIGFNTKLDLFIMAYKKSLYIDMVDKITDSMSIEEIEAEVEMLQINIHKCQIKKEINIDKQYEEYMRWLYDADRNKGISSGLIYLDSYLGNFQRGRLVTIFARSGVGKTTFSLQIAANMAFKGAKVLYGSAEMSTKQVYSKMAASNLSLSSKEIDEDKITKEAKDGICDFMGRLFNRGFYISTETDIDKFINEIKVYKLQNSLDIVFIDYINKYVDFSDKDIMTNKLGKISSKLKTLAMEEDICVVLLAQANRSVDKRTSDMAIEKIDASDIQDSARIEQDSDQVIALYRNIKLDDKMYRESLFKKGKIKYNSKNAENNPECMNVVVLKNRHGERGTCAVKWQGRYSRVVDF